MNVDRIEGRLLPLDGVAASRRRGVDDRGADSGPQAHDDARLAPARWRHPPLWDDNVLWQHQTSVELEPGRRWYPFGFDIPPGLPPGMEGYIVSWRYEIEAHRRVRARPDERAVITPLRFEIG